MKCERCHSAEATKALSVEIDGQPSTLFVCEECAAKAAAEKPPAKPAADGDAPDAPEGGMDIAASRPFPSLPDLLLDMARRLGAAQKGGKPPVFEVHVRDSEGHEIHASSEDVSEESEPEPKCPLCHMTLDELRDGRRFGCPECYETFRDEVPVFTREMQYDDRHVGRQPRRLVREAELHDLTLRLRKAVARQRFREAEQLSARIRALGGDPAASDPGTEP